MLPQPGRAASVFVLGHHLRWPRSHARKNATRGKWFSTLLTERVLVVQLFQFRQNKRFFCYCKALKTFLEPEDITATCDESTTHAESSSEIINNTCRKINSFSWPTKNCLLLAAIPRV